MLQPYRPDSLPNSVFNCIGAAEMLELVPLPVCEFCTNFWARVQDGRDGAHLHLAVRCERRPRSNLQWSKFIRVVFLNHAAGGWQ